MATDAFEIDAAISSSGGRIFRYGDGGWIYRSEAPLWAAPRDSASDERLELALVRSDLRDRELPVWGPACAPFSIWRFEVVFGSIDEDGRRVADIQRALGASSNAGLEELASKRRDACRRPVRDVGVFLQDHILPEHYLRRGWAGETATLRIENDDDAAAAAEVMRRLFANAADNREDAAAFAAERLLESANEWRRQGGCSGRLSDDGFVSALTLDSILARADGRYEFSFLDGGLFGGHVVTVEGSMETGLRSAHVEG